MGIKNLKLLIKKYAHDAISEKYFHEFNGEVIAIDISIYLYQFTYRYGDPLEGFVNQTMRFIKNGVTPLYIFDGPPPAEKKNILDERYERKQEMKKKHKDLTEILEVMKKNDVNTVCDLKETEEIKEKADKNGDI